MFPSQLAFNNNPMKPRTRLLRNQTQSVLTSCVLGVLPVRQRTIVVRGLRPLDCTLHRGVHVGGVWPRQRLLRRAAWKRAQLQAAVALLGRGRPFEFHIRYLL